MISQPFLGIIQELSIPLNGDDWRNHSDFYADEGFLV